MLAPILKEASDCIAQITKGSGFKTTELLPAIETMDACCTLAFLVSQLCESYEHRNSRLEYGLNLFFEEEFVVDAWRPGSRYPVVSPGIGAFTPFHDLTRYPFSGMIRISPGRWTVKSGK